ncbi:hypothetical protein PGTUg99_002342 [Puccinia graminis f. sp. tritici]|uniref:Uncharacterized protein n=1 Tax=Puccinia graminis f. sp. tritici TaxID=56615 RepID=A0A5B0QLI4_PUCGR|nr:hypothetical protein PGTUg99_002342 [Puccinia graminis f. sp. tritici]
MSGLWLEGELRRGGDVNLDLKRGQPNACRGRGTIVKLKKNQIEGRKQSQPKRDPIGF